MPKLLKCSKCGAASPYARATVTMDIDVEVVGNTIYTDQMTPVREPHMKLHALKCDAIVDGVSCGQEVELSQFVECPHQWHLKKWELINLVYRPLYRCQWCKQELYGDAKSIDIAIAALITIANNPEDDAGGDHMDLADYAYEALLELGVEPKEHKEETSP